MITDINWLTTLGVTMLWVLAGICTFVTVGACYLALKQMADKR